MAFQIMKEISTQQVEQQLERGVNLNMIDVREPHEWIQGHWEQATSLPISQLASQFHQLDRTKSYIVLCRSGARSGLACEFLQEQGYNVTNMSGGLMSATGPWRVI